VSVLPHHCRWRTSQVLARVEALEHRILSLEESIARAVAGPGTGGSAAS
jgi:hypothetical protein